MKKILLTLVLGWTAIFLLCAPALAQMTGIALDGKTYTFFGADGTYETDGKTFILAPDRVTIREEGKPDRTLPLTHAEDTSIVSNPAPESVRIETVFLEQIQTDAQTSAAVTEDGTVCSQTADDAPGAGRFDAYARFGLGYDAANDALYFQGQRVRIFQDFYALDAQCSSTLEHVDEKGVIDVEAIRDPYQAPQDMNESAPPFGTLTGLRVLSAQEFAKRDITSFFSAGSGACTEGSAVTPAEKKAIFAPYEPYGIFYDVKTGRARCQGKIIRNFLDIRKSNGESLSSGKFSGTLTQLGNDEGEIDVTILRDFSLLDENGEGAIIGVQTIPVQ